MVDAGPPPPASRPQIGRGASGAIAVAALVPAGMALTLLLTRGIETTVRDIVWLGVPAAFSVAGASLFRRAETRAFGVVTLVAVVLAGSGFAAAVWRRAETDTDVVRGVESLSLALIPATALALVAVMPDGRLPSRGGRWLAGAATLIFAGAGVVHWKEQPDPSPWPLMAIATVLIGLGIVSANERYRVSEGLARSRMQWIGLAGALWVEVVLVVGGLHILIDWPRRPLESITGALVLLAMALWASSIPSLVGRVDRLLTHAVSAAGLTAAVTVIYFVVVIGLGRAPTEDDQRVLVLSMVAAAASALAYPWTRAVLRDLANRLVYGGSESPSAALTRFGDRLTRSVPMDELLLQLVEQCTTSLGLRSAEVWTGVDGRLSRTASVPAREPGQLVLGPKEIPVVTSARMSGRGWTEVWLPALLEPLGIGPVRVAPLVHAGELFGVLVLEREESGEDFTEDEDQMLADLGRQMGLALHNSELDSALQATLDEVRAANAELEASRARLVAAGDRERRRIERNLHDGAQQHLVALAVKLKLIQRLADSDLEQALAMVEEARADALATVEELRILAHGIFPPLLVDKGLGEALRAAARRSPLDVSVDADGVARYRQEDEAAVYFCCLEALQNAAKYAGDDARVRIRLAEVDGELRFSITDDGRGFDLATPPDGHGFVNMTDRVGALGGTVEVSSRPGEGTEVAGCIPQRQPEESPRLSSHGATGS